MCEGWHWGAGSFLMARDSSLVPASFLLYNSKVTKGECVMSLIRKLGWFFKLEARRYIIGILALSLVSVFNRLLMPLLVAI